MIGWYEPGDRPDETTLRPPPRRTGIPCRLHGAATASDRRTRAGRAGLGHRADRESLRDRRRARHAPTRRQRGRCHRRRAGGAGAGRAADVRPRRGNRNSLLGRHEREAHFVRRARRRARPRHREPAHRRGRKDPAARGGLSRRSRSPSAASRWRSSRTASSSSTRSTPSVRRISPCTSMRAARRWPSAP